MRHERFSSTYAVTSRHKAPRRRTEPGKGDCAGTAAPRLPGGGTTAVPAKDTAGSGPSASMAFAWSGSRSGGTHTPFRGAGRAPVSRTSLPTTTTVPQPC
ncbi:hypothetical protein GCM10010425_56790 [Streptomyces spororaveus]|uniref:Uncharacterized protein n=1 Tax=Streptomyces spororaveus TaxID=284039 RepID=A0ABQ3THE0_9ACTN|nr:hypothetical protein Sspor_53380 [Streptomyces spororaveus]